MISPELCERALGVVDWASAGSETAVASRAALPINMWRREMFDLSAAPWITRGACGFMPMLSIVDLLLSAATSSDLIGWLIFHVWRWSTSHD
jgi:hypothetical protein